MSTHANFNYCFKLFAMIVDLLFHENYIRTLYHCTVELKLNKPTSHVDVVARKHNVLKM